MYIFRKKDISASWPLLKTWARLGYLWKNFTLEICWRHQRLNSNGIGEYMFHALPLSTEVMFKISGDFLLFVWKMRQHLCGSANIRISWSEVVIWELSRCLLQKHEWVLKTWLFSRVRVRVYTVTVFSLA